MNVAQAAANTTNTSMPAALFPERVSNSDVSPDATAQHSSQRVMQAEISPRRLRLWR